MLLTRFLCAVAVLLVASMPTAQAAPKEKPPKLLKPRPAILECRPCGPDSIRGPLRYLIFQGCAGADFREACRNHDACYDVPGSDRDACDRQFLADMLAECPKSRQPLRARYRAHLAYFGVKFCGKGAWRSAQELAEMAGKLVEGAVQATQVDRLVNPHRQSGN